MLIEEAIQLAKNLKKPIIYITNEYILGTDINYSSLNTMILYEKITNLNRPICYETKDLLITDAKINKIASTSPSLFLNYYIKISDRIYLNTFGEYDMTKRIMQLYRRCMCIVEGSKTVLKINNISKENSEYIDTVSKLKSGDGMKYLILGKYIMSTFIPMHPETKTDNVNFECLEIDDLSFMAIFQIMKKKNIIINEYIRYRMLI